MPFMNFKIVNAKNIEIEFKKLLIYGITIQLFTEVLIISCHCYIRVSTHIAGLAAKPKDVLDTLDLTNFGVKTLLVYWSLFRYN